MTAICPELIDILAKTDLLNRFATTAKGRSSENVGSDANTKSQPGIGWLK